MKQIGELIDSVKKYNKVTVQKEYKSKKNTVAYVTFDGKPRVLKWFVPGLKTQMKNEYKILNEGAKKIQMPFVYELDEDNNVLILNHVNGENLCDMINDEEITYDEKKRLIILLAEWYINFHNHFKKEDEFRIRGDSSLRNFIFTDKIIGLDFEESRKGSPVEDIAQMCASILTTNPMFSKEKFDLCKTFINTYVENVPGRILNINGEIAYAILERIQYRAEDEELLRKYSKKIRNHGL